jgi:hypothetical protein
MKRLSKVEAADDPSFVVKIDARREIEDIQIVSGVSVAGFVVLGQPLNARNRRKANRLRTISELFSESSTPKMARTLCQAVRQLKPWIGRNRSSTRRSLSVRWRCWPNSLGTAG